MWGMSIYDKMSYRNQCIVQCVVQFLILIFSFIFLIFLLNLFIPPYREIITGINEAEQQYAFEHDRDLVLGKCEPISVAYSKLKPYVKATSTEFDNYMANGGFFTVYIDDNYNGYFIELKNGNTYFVENDTNKLWHKQDGGFVLIK